MKFGMALLILILVCSLIGSVIVQRQTAEYYAAEYPGLTGVISALLLDDIFSSWYFITLLALLGVNLLFCSVLRLKSTLKLRDSGISRALKKESEPVSGNERDKIEAFLKSRHFKHKKEGQTELYYKNRTGYFGSFITHLAILMVLVFAAGAMYLSKYEDRDIYPGESYTMDDGTVIAVDSFTLGEGDKPDYVSTIRVTDKSGNESGEREISVNYPLSFGGHKFYQHSYGVAGHATVTNAGKTSGITLEEGMFMTVDGENGVTFEALYPDHMTDSDGTITPIDADDYAAPVYLVKVTEDGETKEGVVLPGTTLAVDNVLYTFDDPAYYPGIRIKTVPGIVMGLLYLSFGLLIAGLYLCFFHVPIYVKIDKSGFAVDGPKIDPGFLSDIDALRRAKC